MHWQHKPALVIIIAHTCSARRQAKWHQSMVARELAQLEQGSSRTAGQHRSRKCGASYTHGQSQVWCINAGNESFFWRLFRVTFYCSYTNPPLVLKYKIVSEDVFVLKMLCSLSFICHLGELCGPFGRYTIAVSVRTYFLRILSTNDTDCPQKCQEPYYFPSKFTKICLHRT